MSNRVITIKSTSLSANSYGEIYRDVSMKAKNILTANGNNSYRIDKLIDVKAVMNSLTNIFTWLRGERVINPEFGSDLRRVLYDGITSLTEEKVVAEINQCITRWEPRVTIQEIQNISSIEETEDNTMEINIVFKIKGLDQIYNHTLTYNINEK